MQCQGSVPPFNCCFCAVDLSLTNVLFQSKSNCLYQLPIPTLIYRKPVEKYKVPIAATLKTTEEHDEQWLGFPFGVQFLGFGFPPFPPVRFPPASRCSSQALKTTISGVWISSFFFSISEVGLDLGAEDVQCFIMISAASVGWTKTGAIYSLTRKAGYNDVITESLQKRIRLTRYQSTVYTMNYSEYVSYVKATRGTMPNLVGSKSGNQ
ncbi:hypothetical protein Droror1_Dr00006510 [Drosera rotundifolia]